MVEAEAQTTESSSTSSTGFVKDGFDSGSLTFSDTSSVDMPPLGDSISLASPIPQSLSFDGDASKFIVKVKLCAENDESRMVRVRLSQIVEDSVGVSLDKLAHFIKSIVNEDHQSISEMRYQDDDGEIANIVTSDGLLEALEQALGRQRLEIAVTMEKNSHESTCMLKKVITPQFSTENRNQKEELTENSSESVIDSTQTAKDASPQDAAGDAAKVSRSIQQVSSALIHDESKLWKKFSQTIDCKGPGVALSKDGTTLVVGSRRDNNTRGFVRVYKLTDKGIWSQLGSDVTGRNKGGHFGYSVAISGDGTVLAVGSPRVSIHKNSSYVEMYELKDGDWKQLGRSIVGDRYFGRWLSLSYNGRVVAMKSSCYHRVKVYEYGTDDWRQRSDDIEVSCDQYRTIRSISLSSDGDTVAVGLDSHGNQVEIFSWARGTWCLVGTIVSTNSISEFGYSVSLSADGSMVAIGSPYTTIGDKEIGELYVYKRSEDNWTQAGNTIFTVMEDRSFGYSVSLSSCGKLVAVGSPCSNSTKGAVHAYKLVDETWIPLGGDVVGETDSGYFGEVVNLSGDGSVLVVSSPGVDKVEVYTL